MYTQCPDCNTAFRVTADVLRQAAGKVRCGGCSNAFNALDFLSENLPEEKPTASTSGSFVPELTPDAVDDAAGLPRSISAKQSAALLKTLDQLAGSDIRIEDTGVEWRVLDEQDVAVQEAGNDALELVDQTSEALGENRFIVATDESIVDEILDESPTPVDEFLTKTPDVIDSEEIFDASANEIASTSVDELRFDDNTPLPDDFDLDDEASYLPAASDETNAPEPSPILTEPRPDIALSEPGEWTDILGEFDDLADELTGRSDHENQSDDDVEADDDTHIDEDLDAADDLQVDEEPVAADEDPIDAQLDVDEDDPVDDELAALAEEDIDNDVDDGDVVLDVDTQFALQAEAMGIDISGIQELDEEEPALHMTIADELAALEELEAEDEEAEEEEHAVAADDSNTKPVVAPLTKDEQTLNMMIDQDLMAIAIEDEDGFASTMVVADEVAEQALPEAFLNKATGHAHDEADFETIIMEGDSARSTDDDQKYATDTATAAEIARMFKELPAEPAASSGRMRNRLVGGIVILVLTLIVQLVHQSREALATIPAFNSAIGPIYRALGQPLQPEWDITGWRFEASKGSADGVNDATAIEGAEIADEEITVYSRIGNKSEQALPYPLINVSLVDRFEESVGSRILDPAEYLPNDLDPSKLVQPGKSFGAVISIQSPSEDVTGFKLNVCYRLSNGQLRCAIDDFK